MSELTIGIHDAVPAESYHRDELTPEPALSRSGIVILANGATLADFAAQSPRLRNPAWPNLRDSTDASDLGEVAHALVLGVGAQYVVADCSDFNAPSTGKPYQTWSGDAKAWKEGQEASGMIVIGRERFAMAEMISAKLTAVLRERFGAEWDQRKCEQTVICKRRLNDGSEIWCRIRIDALIPSAIIDVKTTALSLADVALGKEMALKGLDFQHAFYQDVTSRAMGEGRDEVPLPFVFGYVQTVPPYAVRLVNLDDPDIAWPLSMTRMDIDAAAHRFGAALKSGTWDGDPVDAKPVAPEWWKSQKAWKLMQAGLLEEAPE